jgi:hypothetical protein
MSGIYSVKILADPTYLYAVFITQAYKKKETKYNQILNGDKIQR